MPLSAKDASILARTNIENARNARGSEAAVIKFYQTAKNALAGVDATKTGIAALKDMIAAFEELAAVLDHSGEQSRRKAVKCRQRAHGLSDHLTWRIRTHRTIASTLNGPAFPLQVARAGANNWEGLLAAKSATSTAAIIRISSVTLPEASAAALNTLTTTLQPPLPSPFPDIVVTAASGPHLFFSKDLNPVPFSCRLPDPGESLQTTRQLAYCLALFEASAQEDGLFPEALEWRRFTLNNSDEKGRLETLSIQIIEVFAENTMKDAAVVAEVVQLTPVLNEEHSRFLIKTFIDTINQSEILHLHSLEGLAKTIQGSAAGSLDPDDLVTILRCLHKRLGLSHSASQHNQYLIVAVSWVLDAMVDAHIGDVDRVKLYEPLSDLLRESESSKNPYSTFQAAYATQALLNVSDDENIWQAGFRRAWLVLKGSAGFAKMPDLTEIKDALEGLEKLYDAGKGGVRLYMDIKEALTYDERPTFTKEEGLKFKRAWYRALRTAETYIRAGELVKFKDLVTTISCRNQLMFQWGICQLLGQFAADIQWELKGRQEAIVFLGALIPDDRIWKRQKELDQVIFDALTNLASVNGMNHEVVKPLLVELIQQNATLKPIVNPQSPFWSNKWFASSTSHMASKTTLLKAVQDRNSRNTKLENLPNQPVPSSLHDIHSALKAYHEPDLSILRVSGQKLDLETCYVNLAIVEAQEHREKEKQDLKEEAAVFHRISSFERVRNTNTQSLIPLEQLFDKRKQRDGKEITPKRILVQGRAGIGKTTLCKKLVHIHQSGRWSDLFDTVLWLPLRRLRGCTSRTLEDLFCEKIFVAQGLKQEQAALANALAIRAQNGKVLFILDGLDEILTDTGDDENNTFRTFLKKVLLEQEYVVITSRPSGVDSTLLPPIDLDLETVGFNQQNVTDFVVKILDSDPARTVLDFIQQTPLIHGLVNIPVQLDVICFTWDSLPKDGPALTMTGLYQLMVRKLWCKDAVRLKKEANNGKVLMEKHIHKLSLDRINKLMAEEVQHLGYLAFKGMKNKHQIEFDEDDLLSAFEDLEDEAAENQGRSPPEYVDALKETSFLHTADVDPNLRGSNSRQAWHFLHLTFQEYFAATWIVRHFQSKPKSSTTGMMTAEQVEAFVHQHKYNPQYEIVWSMVAGLLEGDPLRNYFQLFQGAPRDLIGGRHLQILASCLNEARTRLDATDVAQLDLEIMDWMRFEMQPGQHHQFSFRRLGSQLSFPEIYLIKAFDSLPSWKRSFIHTLGARSALSDSAFQFLNTIFQDEEQRIRRYAALALGKQSTLPEPALQSLIAALKDENRYVRISAAEALGYLSSLPKSAIQSLVAALKDGDANLSYLAASALGKLSTLPKSAIESLMAALKDEDVFLRYSAALALGNLSTLPKSAIQSLIAALKDKHGDVRSSAAWALGQQPSLPEAALQSLTIAALTDKYDNARDSAASALGSQSKLSESALESLIAALGDEDGNVRGSAAFALGKQSTLPESVIQSLIAAFRDEVGDVRGSAASTLGKQSTLSESAIQSLIAALRDEVGDVRGSAAEVLGSLSTLPESALQPLIATLKDEHPKARSSAASALGKQSTISESALQPLIATLKDEHPDVRYAAASALGKQCTLPESVIQYFIDALKDEDSYVRALSAEILGSRSTLPELALQLLIAALEDEDSYLRALSAEILGSRPTLPGLALQLLIAALEDGDQYVRQSAASALGKQSTVPEAALQPLMAALKDENDDLKMSAIGALQNQSALPESTIQSLIAAHKAGDDFVRWSVSETLEKHLHSLCISLSHLTADEVAYLYENHLFGYSCSHVLSLQVQNGRMRLYTEQGAMDIKIIGGGGEGSILSAFRRVHLKAGLKL